VIRVAPGQEARSKLTRAVRHRGLFPITHSLSRGGAMTEAEIESLKLKISTLRLEHHDLDAAICRMEESRIFEDEQLHRLKKKKLFLKDQISLLERKLGPDSHH
jgi:hypothetical protein